MFDFDLQIFADEEAENVAGTAVTEEAPAEEQEPIPDELEGLSEETAREVMEQAEQLAEKEQGNEPAPTGEDEDMPKGQNIPYPRWKQKVDEANALKAKVEEYEKRLAAMQNTSAPASAPTTPPAQQAPTMPNLQFTPEITAEINKYVQAEAMRMTGMSQEDVDSIEYMEDGDPRVTQYNTAKRLAETAVYNRIQQAQIQQAAQSAEFLRLHQASINSYNEFYKKETAEPDWEQITKYIVNDYVPKLAPADQAAVASAYNRIERNTASPQDIMLVKTIYSQGKAQFRSGRKSPRAKKVQAAQSFPRSQQVSGTGDTDSMSAESIQRMLETTPWNEIPKDLQKKFLGM